MKRWLPIIAFLICSPLLATTYYVSNSGSDSNNGTATGTPWQTISKVNAETFNPGDSVLFQDGGTWREQLVPPSAGLSGNQVTFGSYGSGASPVISGSNVASSWTNNNQSGTNFTTNANMQGYYYFEEATGANAPDGTGNGNTLTNTGTVSQSTNHIQGSYSAQFNGSSQYFTAADASLSANFPGKNGLSISAITIGGWIYWTGSGNSREELFHKGSSPEPFAIYLNNQYIYAETYNGGAFTNTTSNGPITANTWVHVVAVISTANGIQLYINGVLQTGNPSISTLVGASGALYVGYQGSGDYWNGDIDEAFFMNSGLSGTQVASIYQYGLDGTRNNTVGYYASNASEPNQVFFNANRLNQVSLQSSLATGDWWWNSGNNSVYIYDNPTGNTVEIGTRSYGVEVNDVSYLKISGLTFQRAEADGIYIINGAVGVLVDSDTLSQNYTCGLVSSSPSTDQTNLEIRNSTATHNGGGGICIFDHNPGAWIHNNVANNNVELNSSPGFWAGIKFNASTTSNVIVEKNLTQNNGLVVQSSNSGSGIWFDTGANGTIRNNFSSGNWMDGIRVESTSTGTSVYGNVASSNTTGDPALDYCGIDLASSSTGAISNTLVYNNTVYGNVYGVCVFGGASPNVATNNTVQNNISFGNQTSQLFTANGGDNNGTQGSGNVYTYNSFGTAATNFIQWALNTNYSTYALWEAAAGNCGTTGCSHSIQTTPTLKNSSGGQLWQTSGSSGIASGTPLGSPYNIGIQPGSSWPTNVFPALNVNNDLGAFVYTGTVIDAVTGAGTQASGTMK